MNTPEAPSSLSPFQIIGQLTSLYGRGVTASNLGLAGLESWTKNQFREHRREVEDLQAQLKAIGPPRDHTWRGVTRAEPILQAEFREFLDNLDHTARSLESIAQAASELAGLLGLPLDEGFRLKDVHQLGQFGIRLVSAPPVDRNGIADPSWDGRAAEIARLVERGRALAETRYREQYRRLEDMRVCLSRVGPLDEHPCRGVKRAEPLSVEQLRGLPALLFETVDSLRAVLHVVPRLEDALHLPRRPEASLKTIQQLEQFARHILRAPRMDRSRIGLSIWDARRDQVVELVNLGQALSATRADLAAKVADVAWETDLSAARRDLAGHGRSFFRWFNRDYRGAVATLRGILKLEPPRKLGERLEILDAMISAHATSRSLDGNPTLSEAGRDAFGNDWKGSRSDWARLAAILAWDEDCRTARLARCHRSALAGLDQPELCQEPHNALSERLQLSFKLVQSLIELIELDSGQAFGVDAVHSVPVGDLVARLCQWQERPEALTDWIDYRASQRSLELAGMATTSQAIREGRISMESALSNLQSGFQRDLESDVQSLRGVRPGHEPATRDRLSTEGAVLEGLGRDAFGSHWKGLLSDWPALESIVKWEYECREANLAWNHRHHLSGVDSVTRVRSPLRTMVDLLNKVPGRLESLIATIELDLVETFARESSSRIPIRELLSRIRRWQDEPEGLSKWILYQMRRTQLKAAGLGPLVDALHEGRIPLEAAVDQIHVSYYQALIHDVFRRHRGLAAFDGQTYEQWVEEFRALDLSRIEMKRAAKSPPLTTASFPSTHPAVR